MPSPKLPDPLSVARQEAEAINKNPEQTLYGSLNRSLIDAPHLDRESLLSGLVAFHQERMRRTPSMTTYPEAKAWVDHILAVDRELQRLARLSDEAMAIYRSLSIYLTFRGYRSAQAIGPEKCRVAYLPETDRGEMHIKNVDDPATFWNPQPVKTDPGEWREPPKRNLVWDGVGSGLHFDDEPEEIFPLPVPAMCAVFCDDVPGAVSFLARYRPFWGGQNIVLHDAQKRSVAIEKTSYNFIEVFEPDATGRSWCSGMACRDAHSPQGRYQAAQRQTYLDRFNLPADGPDAAFWAACNVTERMLSDVMRNPATIPVDDVLRLFVTPYPDGLCKDNWHYHPQQPHMEWTLVTCASVGTADRQTSYTWQRGPLPDLIWPDQPVVRTVCRPE